MIEIDGASGERGGAILRQAVGLAAYDTSRIGWSNICVAERILGAAFEITPRRVTAHVQE